ncbi:sulfatase-like hydrolase/transferase [Algoriphagus yeomjeoni]|uniref:Arylsulfatase A-like enzyme n=1 Tax=Algoriphagus yeomjeoni TaxID=291403 RepID=A0A327P0R4_9BACT|nr:sulfatase-like hydrolase/transferase [Algoriphagus yeomjeoni]RAI85800.1 arylsulfatase A-like enzyme [Algoriphagus yeomjeoni]
MTKLRLTLHLAFYAFLAISSIACTSKEEAISPPNIIVFLVDDMGLMDTSVPFLTDEEGKPVSYDLNNYYSTPNMELLARQGIRFSNFYAHSVCSPSRTSILTGQNSARHGVTNWIRSEENNRTEFGPDDWNWTGLSKNSVTLPKLLQEKGYKTIHVGKAHFGPFASEGENPLNLGFDVNIAGSSIGQPGSYLGTESFGLTGGNKARAVPGLEKYHGQDIFLTEALTLEANAAIAQAKEEGKPFFLNMAHYAVHAPFYSDPRFAEKYKDSGMPEKAQAYATLIEGIDKSLGDIIQHVKELGIGENTLILFLGDNGSDAPLPIVNDYSSSTPLKGKKGNHWEGGMRVPFIAAWISPDSTSPNQLNLPIAQNAIQTQLGTILDIFPTLASLVDFATPEKHTLDGSSLHTQLNSKENTSREELFLNHFPHGNHRSNYFTSLVRSDWKVIYHYPIDGKPGYELFNLKTDPFEMENLAESNPAQLKIMMEVMLSEMSDKKAQYPEKDGKSLELIIPN